MSNRTSSLFYKILVFAFLFMLVYPEHYIFLPFSTIRIVQIFGIAYSIFYFYKNTFRLAYQKICYYGILIFIVGFLSAYVFNTGGDLDVAKRGILMILYIFSALWIAFLLKKSDSSFSLYTLIEWIVLITVFQAIITIIFFLVPTIADTYRSFVVADDSILESMANLSSFRMVGIGDVRYATSAVQYGLVMWGVIALKHDRYGFWGSHPWYSNIIITLFTLVGIMSGRVFFVIILVTVPYIYLLNDRKLKRSIKDVFSIFIPTFIIGAIAFIYVFANNEELVKWAFELFINLGDSGQLESASTNQLKEMYIFPNNMKTWLIGDGKSIDVSGGFYMSSDVGYIRSIFYWGIIGTLVYYSLQYKCYRIFTSYSNNKTLNIYVTFLLLWLYIYSFKDFYSIERYLVLFTVIQILTIKNTRQFIKND